MVCSGIVETVKPNYPNLGNLVCSKLKYPITGEIAIPQCQSIDPNSRRTIKLGSGVLLVVMSGRLDCG